METSDSDTKGQPGQVQAALFGLCPKCGAKTLFAGPTKFADKCGSCGLDYSQFNVGDGPAAFLTLIVGALVVGLALWLDSAWRPPLWVHALLWIPFTSAAVIFGLRAAKGWLLGAEYHRRAVEAQGKDVRPE